MRIDTNAFLDSLPIMGVGLLGIFIVTGVIIIGIYILKALTAKTEKAGEEAESKMDSTEKSAEKPAEKADGKKRTALDLMKEREKNDFLEEEETYEISHDL